MSRQGLLTMKVAITDFTFGSLDVEQQILEADGYQVVSGQCRSAAELISLTGDADAVITQFAPVNAEVISVMEKARVIVRYGIGVDNVDLAVAQEKGIPVCNVPDYCIDEVADHTLAFILATTRQVLPNCVHIREGDWGLATELHEMKTLRDMVTGIVGFGRIGRAVAARLAPFASRRLVSDPMVTDDDVRSAGCEPASLGQLLAESDIITLHCPSTPTTRHMLNAESLSTIKPGCIVINVGRGDLIEPSALESALASGQVAAAALDVFEPEPLPAASLLRTHTRVVTSSHIASASVKAVRTLRQTAARIAAAALRGEPLPNIVNGVSEPRTF